MICSTRSRIVQSVNQSKYAKCLTVSTCTEPSSLESCDACVVCAAAQSGLHHIDFRYLYLTILTFRPYHWQQVTPLYRWVDVGTAHALFCCAHERLEAPKTKRCAV
jgi:hypothetical protein